MPLANPSSTPASSLASLSVTDVFDKLSASPEGLRADEAKRRLNLIGKNRLPRQKKPGLARRILEQLFSPLILILLAVAAIVPLLGHPTDAIVILLVLVFNTTVGVIQEGKASRALEALEKTLVETCTVRRDGTETRVPIEDVVVGDVLILEEGDRIPADGRFIEVSGLRVDEAALTGESTPVDKTAETLSEGTRTALGDIVNAGFAHTHVVAGRGVLLITATGSATEVGQIASALSGAQTEPPLAKKVKKLSRLIALVVMIFSAALFIVGILAGRPPLTLFATVMSLAVSIIPEGLPIVLTLVLARGVSHMAKKNAVVKKLNAVEGLGQVQVICTDKTGTLTTNHLTVQRAWGNGDWNESDPGLVRAAAFFGDNAKDPINAALLAFATRAGSSKDGWTRIEEKPFNYETRHRSIRAERGGERLACMAGSPEGVITACEVDETERKTIQTAISEAARQGLRVIALASRDGNLPLDNKTPWSFSGFVAMGDTLRPRVVESVAWCHAQGIRVVMITGDHPETALAIAKSAGIADKTSEVLNGTELETMDDAALAARLDGVRVFSRIAPTHKLRIINAYRALGLITAMTGDGVNDAPALHRADIGIAMGKSGTDVAREAAHLVLMDDNFATIIDAIKEGRATVANVRRVIMYLFSTSFAEAALITATLLAGFPLPLLPGQIIWINLVTDSFLDISLGLEPAHGTREQPTGALIDRRSVVRMFLLGGTMAVGTFAVYANALGDSTAHLQTITLTTLAAFQWMNAWNARSETRSLGELSPFSNKPLLAATGIVVTLQLIAVYAPPFQALLGTVPLSFADWGIVLGLSSTVILVDEIWKKARHKARGKKAVIA
ncbi:MAG: HAD-IC family P-type ATPase [Patescibacteria group bacterium]|jgi:Ca2+-transporting ATPase